MRKFLFLMLIFVTASLTAKSQTASTNEQTQIILSEKSYHEDLATYPKAKKIVELLLEQTELSEAEIKNILDVMVNDARPAVRQVFERFHGLPTYQDTGNPEVDKANYKMAKDQWVQDNPDKYQALINSNKSQK